jgi:hypothetical protein
MVAGSTVQFLEDVSVHSDDKGQRCSGRSFKVIMAGMGGSYTNTVECLMCHRQFEAHESGLLNKPEIDLNKIRQAAAAQNVDFDDPKNAFTVWSETSGAVIYCGGAENLEASQALAAKHINLERLYIVRANPPAIMPFPNRRYS